jgi:hypothetical protein
MLQTLKIVVSEWLLFNTTISLREQVNFQWDDDEVLFILDQQAELDFYSANSLKQQSAGKHVTPPAQIILIPWVWALIGSNQRL